MKRCPHCEFIYEDEQDLCDMDGRELERVPAAPPVPHGAAERRQRRPAALPHRRFLALLISGVVLAAALTSGYYVRTSQTATGHTVNAPASPAAANPQAEITPPQESPAPALNSPPDPTRPSPAPPPKMKVTPPAAAPQRRAGGSVKVGSPAVRSIAQPAVRQGEKATRPESHDSRREPKKESKLGAALKKAGRVLKKPFRF